MHFAAVAYVGESTVDPLKYVFVFHFSSVERAVGSGLYLRFFILFIYPSSELAYCFLLYKFAFSLHYGLYSKLL